MPEKVGTLRMQFEAVALAKQLHKQGMGYRAIGAELAKTGHVNERGRPFHHKSVRAKRLHRANPVTGKRRSLRKIAAELAAVGHLNSAKYGGSDVPRPFNPGTIKAMIEGPAPAMDKRET
jgi:hypothetical protein